jgi:general stress protein 26
MSEEMKKKVIAYMAAHNICSFATTREDGFPQANTVTYANDGTNIFFVTARESQKIKNIKFNSKVSLTIDEYYPDWSKMNKIKGITLGGTADILTNKEEIDKAMELLLKKFPFYANFPPMDLVVVRVIPKIIHFLDYEIAFGHQDVLNV